MKRWVIPGVVIAFAMSLLAYQVAFDRTVKRPIDESKPIDIISLSDGNQHTSMRITSPVMTDGGVMPAEYTCDGSNQNPPLEISNIPEGARVLVLVMDDHDVPRAIRPSGVWDHWVVFNIPIPENRKVIIEEGQEPEGVRGMTDFGSLGYGGPCPPDGEHRYEFRVYALAQPLDFPEGASKNEIESAARSQALSIARFSVRYARH